MRLRAFARSVFGILGVSPALGVLVIRVEEAGGPWGTEKGMLLTTGFSRGARVNYYELAGQVPEDWHIWSAAQHVACNLWLGFFFFFLLLHGKAI